MVKTIGIVGSRRRDSDKDFDLVHKVFRDLYNPGDTICSGLCPKGGDRFAVVLANEYDTLTLWFPAEWNKYGKSAGFRRNDDIAKNSDLLIACVAEDRKGGTEDTISKFVRFHGMVRRGERFLYIV